MTSRKHHICPLKRQEVQLAFAKLGKSFLKWRDPKNQPPVMLAELRKMVAFATTLEVIELLGELVEKWVATVIRLVAEK